MLQRGRPIHIGFREIARDDEEQRHMKRLDYLGQPGMIPTKEMASNHQQDADAFHDIEGGVALAHSINTSFLGSPKKVVQKNLYMGRLDQNQYNRQQLLEYRFPKEM